MAVKLNKFLTISVTIGTIAGGIGAIYGLYVFNINRKKSAISKKLTEDIKVYLRGKNYIKNGEVIKIIETETQLSDYFMGQSLSELQKMQSLTTSDLLKLKF